MGDSRSPLRYVGNDGKNGYVGNDGENGYVGNDGGNGFEGNDGENGFVGNDEENDFKGMTGKVTSRERSGNTLLLPLPTKKRSLFQPHKKRPANAGL